MPIPFGIDGFSWKAAILLRRYSKGLMSFGEMSATMTRAFYSEVAPVDPASNESFRANFWAGALNSVLPTLAKPLGEVGTNTTAFGTPIVRSAQAADVRASESGSAMTPEVYKDMAKEIYDVFGIDMRPERVKHIVEGYAVGPLAMVKSATADKAEKTGGARTSEVEELGPVLQALGVGRIYNSGAYNAESLYWGYIDKKNDILKKYNIDVTDPGNKGKPGRKEKLIMQQLDATDATAEDKAFVSRTLDAEKERRKVGKDVRDAAKQLWENGASAEDNAPALQNLYEKDDRTVESFLQGVR
jgi:hypothetical protein